MNSPFHYPSSPTDVFLAHPGHGPETTRPIPPSRQPRRGRWLPWCLTLLAIPSVLLAAPLAYPQVDTYNIRIGTQTFGPRYRFTTNSVLIETAEAIRAMDSDVIKFYLGRDLARQYPGLTLPSGVTNLTSLARDEPSYRRVLSMPFRHYLLWAYCLSTRGDAPWTDGFSSAERETEYRELFDLTRYLLTTFNNSGKQFYLGHWEGDWYLLPNYNTATNPSTKAIHGMIDWLNTRQQAVDDALRAVPHTNVRVYHYTEVNRVRDAMLNGPANNQRLVNTVLPAVTNLDFVSWSSYDGMNLKMVDLHDTLNFIAAHLPTNKASSIPGRRVLIGEYGWGGSHSSIEQEPLTRAYWQRLLPWGPPFVLFWEVYDNEDKAFWLIDRHGARTPSFHLHQRFANHARLQVARFLEIRHRLPNDLEFADLVTPALAHPLPDPVALSWSGQDAVARTATSAFVSATLTQGIYGDDQASVWVYYGPTDGGTTPALWSHAKPLGLNTRCNPTAFPTLLTNLTPDADLCFRYCATNLHRTTWAPETTFCSTAAETRSP